MSRQLSAVAALFMSLVVILQDGHQIRAKAFPEARDHLQSPVAATGQATAQPLQRPANQVPYKTSSVRSTEGPVTSQTTAKATNSQNQTHTTKAPPTTPKTTKGLPPTSAPVYTLTTPNNSLTTLSLTGATVGSSSAPHSRPPNFPTAVTNGTSPVTAGHVTRNTTQLSDQTHFPKTWPTAPHNNTTHQKPSPSTQAPETSTATHNATQTASPATAVPGPTLLPWPQSVKTGIYQVLNGSQLCIKAEMGLQLFIPKPSGFLQQRYTSYFSIEPNRTQASGNCGFQKSSLLLRFPGGYVNFTFTKEENSYYISEVEAYLTVSNPEKTYQGLKSSMVMFETVVGHSFKCVSEKSLQLSPQLGLITTNVQLQAFVFEGDHFGNVDECSSDYTIILPVIGAIVVGLFLVGMGVYAIRLRRQSSGYQRIN
ncbi:lysosome-associated membrane glycoprotein 3 [Ctenodactylus gundi]